MAVNIKKLLPAFFITISGIIQAQPPAVRIHITPAQVYDVTQALKKPEKLFDGDTTTPALPDFYNGFILEQTKGQVAWIVLDTFINHPKIEVFNAQYAHGGIVEFQFFYDWTDTTRHSPVYSTTLPGNAWKGVDTVKSRAWKEPARLIKLRIADGGSNNFMEVRVYGHKLGPAASIYASKAAAPRDEGKYFMGYGKLMQDTLMDDCGYSQRAQADMDYIDTVAGFSDGKTIVFNRFGNSVALSYRPAQRNGRKIFPYFAGPRRAFKYGPRFSNDSKDIPIGADSTKPDSWKAVYNTYYGLAAKLGHNSKANMNGYVFHNTDAGTGLGLIEEIEVGNEDDARWAGPLRFHSPLVKLLKLRQGYDGAKAADPSIQVIAGALVGIDTGYLKALYLTNLLRYKTKTMPFDIIAINEYATNGGGQHRNNTDGISPEQFSLYEKETRFIRFRDRYFPGKPVYLTEFGYDVHDGSNYDVPVITGQTREQTKAWWIMRSMEITAAARWSKYYQYTHRNIGGGDFATSGISYDTMVNGSGRRLPAYLHQFMNENVLNNGGWTSLPKDLYWHMTMRAVVLKDYNAWPEIVRRGDSTGIWILKYAHRSQAGSAVYSIWMGTSKNATIKNYVLKAANIKSAVITRAVIGEKHGRTAPAVITAAGITIPVVDESVTYVVVNTGK
jgi:hypothetical protein